MAEIDLIELFIDDMVHQGIAEAEIEERKKRIFFKAQKLEYIKQELAQEKLLLEKEVSLRSQLHHVLGVDTNSGLSLNVKNIKDLVKIGNFIFEAYELTSQILQDLNIIDPVTYTVTYSSKSGNNFMRQSNFTISPEDLQYEIRGKSKGQEILVIRLKQSVIRQKLLKSQSGLERQWVNLHYQNFVSPYKEAQKKSSRGWKVNWGVASEAFERHWEELFHSIDKPIMSNDFGSIGHIWQLYKQSSGSDPYYTGPDTALAQVKNANASIISNADTVLNTLQAVLKLITTKVDASAAAELKNQYLQAFKQKPEKKQISEDIWEAIDETARNELLNAFGAKEIIKINGMIEFL